jgi:farnesyl-diphosphate farnesyltransferase
MNMTNTVPANLLGPLLKSVSRSFYLSLQILPEGMREPVGLAYLLARAADTIADTSLIAPEIRLELLLSFREQVNTSPDDEALKRIDLEIARVQQDSEEKVLLESLRPALSLLSQFDEADRVAVQNIVTTLTRAMEFDLNTFPSESSGRLVAIRDYSELDTYTYLVAGCVGEFWTQMTAEHVTGNYADPLETMIRRGIRLGKALQLTNILRDCGKDLRIGRCYLPEELLAAESLVPKDLLRPGMSLMARPVLYELVTKALDHYREGLDYVLALPRSMVRLRLASLWPILIGLETLLILVKNDHWLEPSKASKIRRSDVHKLVAFSLPVVASNSIIRSWVERLISDIEASMTRSTMPASQTSL